MTCLSAYMYRQISQCTDKFPNVPTKVRKDIIGGGAIAPLPPAPPLATLMTNNDAHGFACLGTRVPAVAIDVALKFRARRVRSSKRLTANSSLDQNQQVNIQQCKGNKTDNSRYWNHDGNSGNPGSEYFFPIFVKLAYIGSIFGRGMRNLDSRPPPLFTDPGSAKKWRTARIRIICKRIQRNRRCAAHDIVKDDGTSNSSCRYRFPMEDGKRNRAVSLRTQSDHCQKWSHSYHVSWHHGVELHHRCANGWVLDERRVGQRYET